MVTSTINYTGNLRMQARHELSGTNLLTDAPIDNQGKGEAFSPTDLLATSLGCCMMTIIGIAAREHQFNVDGTSIEVTKVMLSDPRRVGEVKVEFTFPKHDYTKKEKKIIEAAARTCPVALSLHPDLKQTLIFHYL